MATSAEAITRLNAQNVIESVTGMGSLVPSGASWAANVATITFAAPHGLQVGMQIHVSEIVPVGYNGQKFVIISVTSLTITFALAANPGAYMSGGRVNARVQLGRVNNPNVYPWFARLVQDGPYCVILPARNESWDGQTKHYKLIITAQIFFGTIGDVSQDFLSIEDLVGAIRDALTSTTNWTSSTLGRKTPLDGWTLNGPVSRSDLKPSCDEYSINLMFPGASGAN